MTREVAYSITKEGCIKVLGPMERIGGSHFTKYRENSTTSSFDVPFIAG